MTVHQDAIQDIEMGEKLGSGHFGNVYKGTWQGAAVALKTLQDKSADLLNEVTLLKKLRHPNILCYFGTYSADGKLFLVTEFMSLGSLDTFLRQHKQPLESLCFM